MYIQCHTCTLNASRCLYLIQLCYAYVCQCVYIRCLTYADLLDNGETITDAEVFANKVTAIGDRLGWYTSMTASTKALQPEVLSSDPESPGVIQRYVDQFHRCVTIFTFKSSWCLGELVVHSELKCVGGDDKSHAEPITLLAHEQSYILLIPLKKTLCALRIPELPIRTCFIPMSWNPAAKHYVMVRHEYRSRKSILLPGDKITYRNHMPGEEQQQLHQGIVLLIYCKIATATPTPTHSLVPTQSTAATPIPLFYAAVLPLEDIPLPDAKKVKTAFLARIETVTGQRKGER